jgi:DNA-binding transcriptional regulator GbsR (MarR family)
MWKKKDQRIHEAQGEKSRHIARTNEIHVLLALKMPLTFSELQKETGLSKPVLSKHLRTWMSEDAVYKDTIKRDETKNPKEIGKIVYRANSKVIIPDIVNAIDHTLNLTAEFDEEAKAETRRLLEEIAKIALNQYEKLTVSRRTELKKTERT